MNPKNKEMPIEMIVAWLKQKQEKERHPVLEDFNFTAEDEKWLNEEMRITL